jgi:predicted N-acetyltransferase YhbS
VPTPFRFSYIESENDWDAYSRLLQAAFPGEDVDLLAKRLSTNHPVMTSKNFFSLWDGDKMVATLNLIPQTWNLGGVNLAVAEMGLVASDPEYRKRGLQRTLNIEFDRRIRDDGYHLAAIEGIPYFYRQFGYEYALPLDHWASIPLTRLPQNQSSDIYPLIADEIPRAMELLEFSQRKYIMHSVRSRKEWEAQERIGYVGEKASKTYAVRRCGLPIAYFRATIKDAAILLHEITDTDDETSVQIASFLRNLGDNNGATELVSRESYDAPFNKYLQSLGAKEKPLYGWQVKIIDPFRVIKVISPVLEGRIACSPLRDYTGQVPLNLYGVTVTLTFVSGDITCVKQSSSAQRDNVMINPRVFPKLLLGYRSIDELELEYLDVRLKPEYRELVGVLFPKTTAYIHTCY